MGGGQKQRLGVERRKVGRCKGAPHSDPRGPWVQFTGTRSSSYSRLGAPPCQSLVDAERPCERAGTK